MPVPITTTTISITKHTMHTIHCCVEENATNTYKMILMMMSVTIDEKRL